MPKQRDHSKSILGKNNTKYHDIIYKYIITDLMITEKKCGTCNTIKSPNEFRLYKIEYLDGNIKCDSKIPLQTQCISCDNNWRKIRTMKCHDKYDSLTKADIYQLFKDNKTLTGGGETKKCSRCKENKKPEDFSISKGMECGLHNMCQLCGFEYGESLGDRWIVYRPNGTFKYKKTKKGQHDDHIFPLALGGSNAEINHQLIDGKINLVKSSKLEFDNIMCINPELLSERFRYILHKCQREKETIHDLEIQLRKAISDEHLLLKSKTDEELLKIYDDYNKKNNTRKDCSRAVKKFRQFIKLKY
jgi:hypothetical protein